MVLSFGNEKIKKKIPSNIGTEKEIRFKTPLCDP